MKSRSFIASARARLESASASCGSRAGLAMLAAVLLLGLGLRVGFAVDPPAEQPPDSRAYEQIAANLFRHGSFDARPPGVRFEPQPSSAYSPGLPLLAAGVYLLTGGEHPALVRLLLALLGAATILLSYLLGRRLAGPLAGLIAAGAVAIYPALLEYHGLLLTEPLAAFLLCASLVAFFAATDSRSSSWPWLACGALLGALALVRPEYLILAFVLPLVWALREWRRGALRAAVPAAALCILATVLVIAPWTARNAIALDRFVPISTGGGKALFIGTYLEADGDGPELRELLLDRRPGLRRRFEANGPVDDPNRFILERLLGREATERYPGLSIDAALGRLGRRNLREEIEGHPIALAGMLLEKAFHTWTDSARDSMRRLPWRALQLGLIVLALGGLGLLVARRRFEALALGLVLLYMTGVGALLIASPRRELVVLPVLGALAGVGATACRDSLVRWRR